MASNQPHTKRDAGGQADKTREGKKTVPKGQAPKTPTGAKPGGSRK